MCLFQFDYFLHPMCHKLYIFILSRMWTPRIKDQIPSGYDNIKNMTHRMGESNRKRQDKIKHKMTEDITGGHENINYIRIAFLIRCALRFMISCLLGCVLLSKVSCVLFFPIHSECFLPSDVSYALHYQDNLWCVLWSYVSHVLLCVVHWLFHPICYFLYCLNGEDKKLTLDT
jgi:hypothetical protein